MTADIMFVNGKPVPTTANIGIYLIKVEHTQQRIASQLDNNLNRVSYIFCKASFIVNTLLMDMKFERKQLTRVVVKITAEKEHVAEVESNIMVVNERHRGTLTTLPLMYAPDFVFMEQVHFLVMWPNAFQATLGISKR